MKVPVRLQSVTLRRVVIGLLAGLLLAVGLGWWMQVSALEEMVRDAGSRASVISLGAVRATVEAVGLEGQETQAAMVAYDEANPEVGPIRVVRFGGIRMMASTAPEDSGDQAAPRKMTREEKPFYDLGQSLRANLESNAGEARAWKEEIDVQTLDADRLALAAPVVDAVGTVAGAVLLEAEPPALRALRPSLLGALAFVGVPVLLLLGLGRLGADRPFALLVASLVLLVATLFAYGVYSGGAIRDGRRAAEGVVGERLAQEVERVSSVLVEVGVPAADVDPTDWDIDRFGQPVGLHGSGGLDPVRLEAAIDTALASRRKLLMVLGVGALMLLGFVGLGSADRLAEIVVRHHLAYGYVTPAMATMLLLVFFPFFYGITLSFTNQSIYNTDQPLSEIWVGFENYKTILTDFEVYRETELGTTPNYQNFYWTLGFTIIWTVTNVAVGVSVGLLLALILNAKGLALRPIYRVLLILPWAMPNYITALIWKGMFHSQFGVINQVIQMFGGSAISWFDTPFRAFITVLSTNGWLSFPFMMVISLGALQSIPSDLYEAARVDGAGKLQQFRFITLPSIKPALVPAVILSVVWTFNMFNIIYLVSEGQPGGSTEILITEAYKIAFEQYRYGYAAAYSTVIFLILLVYGVWQNRVTRATEGI